ncbi:hypothetical protein H5972_05490 [Ligilactobacillus salivarius]|nr:hypothetical protein [Ligilactobacillus salivarius]MBM6956716.1 hypothetical protein [Ligilactobacillus salivarius]
MAKSSSRKTTSKKVATKASKALKSKRTSKLTKSLAGSVLAQAKSRKK